MQVITRQRQWPDGNNVVEVSRGGIDYTNPDALGKLFKGEFEEIADPREAIRTAIGIAKAWQLREPDTKIEIATGYTAGMTMPFSGEAVRLENGEWNEPLFDALQDKADEEYEKCPKCDHCGEILGKHQVTWNEDSSWKFCDTGCIERWIEQQEREQADEDAANARLRDEAEEEA